MGSITKICSVFPSQPHSPRAMRSYVLLRAIPQPWDPVETILSAPLLPRAGRAQSIMNSVRSTRPTSRNAAARSLARVGRGHAVIPFPPSSLPPGLQESTSEHRNTRTL